jgi:hypothetical protein
VPSAASGDHSDSGGSTVDAAGSLGPVVDSGGPAVDSGGGPGLDSGGPQPDSNGPTPDSGGAGDAGAGSDGMTTGHDAGSAGDSASDAPVGQPGCTGVVAAFCDDFEMQATGAPPQGMFSVNTGGGATMMVETTKAYSGAKSAHIHVPKGAGGGTDPTAQLTFTKQFPIAANDVHGRAMVFLTKNPNGTGNPNIHWDMVWTSAGNKQYVLGSMYNDRAKAGAFMPVYQPPDDSIDTSTPWPEAVWDCIQWEFRYGGAGGDLLEIKQNGKVIDLGTATASGKAISQGHVATWAAGAWTNLVFGYVHYSTPTPIDVDLWFDDLAFGPQEILCPPMK